MVSHTSDFFDTIAEFARQMIREGNAYMDNTPVEEMRKERGDMVESKCRCVLRMCMCTCMCTRLYMRACAGPLLAQIRSYVRRNLHLLCAEIVHHT
jgi:glutamyl/glutaminyl-tRNA synthetase